VQNFIGLRGFSLPEYGVIVDMAHVQMQGVLHYEVIMYWNRIATLVKWMIPMPSLRISFRLQSLLYSSVLANVLTSINTPLSNFDSSYQMFS
jgi:hypothetical protein